MSRSGYSDDYWAINLYRANVDRAIAGKRGQKFLRELLAALDAMPIKRLIAHDVVRDGEFCALGVVCAQRGLVMDTSEFDDADGLARTLKITKPLAAEIIHLNDEYFQANTPEERWTIMRQWVAERVS